MKVAECQENCLNAFFVMYIASSWVAVPCSVIEQDIFSSHTVRLQEFG